MAYKYKSIIAIMGNQCGPCLQQNPSQSNEILSTNLISSDEDYYDVQLPAQDHFLIAYLKQSFWARNSSKLKKNFKTNRYYYGEWFNGLPQGRGIIYEPSKILIDGNFNNGVPQGKSKIIFISKKCEYEGELESGKISGKGTMINHNQMYSFSGEWKDSEPQKGTLLLTKDKNIEKVEFVDFKERKGKIFYRDGRVYEGEVDWKLLRPHGRGKVKFGTFDVKDFYEGQWKNGNYNGKGAFYWKNGEYYIGSYKQGEKNGYGKFKFLTGNEYEGQWVSGKQEGQGVIYDKNGFKIKQGEWNSGQYIGADRFHHGSVYSIKHDEENSEGRAKDSCGNISLYETSEQLKRSNTYNQSHHLRMRNIKNLYDY